MLGVIGWIVVGVVLAGILSAFWDDIANWLNNVAADYVEEKLGYEARTRMHSAVCKINSIMNKVRNKTTIFTKKNRLDNYIDKTTLIVEVDEYEIDRDIINKIREDREIIQEFEYRN